MVFAEPFGLLLASGKFLSQCRFTVAEALYDIAREQRRSIGERLNIGARLRIILRARGEAMVGRWRVAGRADSAFACDFRCGDGGEADECRASVLPAIQSWAIRENVPDREVSIHGGERGSLRAIDYRLRRFENYRLWTLDAQNED